MWETLIFLVKYGCVAAGMFILVKHYMWPIKKKKKHFVN